MTRACGDRRAADNVKRPSDVRVRMAKRDELPLFVEMESGDHAREYVGQSGVSGHRRMFDDDTYIHLTILAGDVPAGFILLVLDDDGVSIDFRRIVVTRTDSGIGQASITAMESWCSDNTDRSRIWLNVYDFNQRGIHVYRKLGYRYFESEDRDGKILLYFDKLL